MSLIDILVLDIVLKFDVCRSFSLSNYSEFGKNVITFGADMSSSVHIDDKKKDILILDKDVEWFR